MKISIILPAYNEAKRLKNTVKIVKKYLDKINYDYEIIIAEDGSTDGTDKIAQELVSKDKRIIHLHSDERLGKGKALTRAIQRSKGDVVVFVDVDLSTDIIFLKKLIEAITKENYDIAIGSRLLKESETERPLKREIASRVYNSLVRLLLKSKIHDHQCGFKAFRKNSILPLLKKVKDTHWFWDTEILVLAQWKGLKIKEIPVKWKQSKDTKIKFTRDIVYMFSQVIKMYIENNKPKLFIILLGVVMSIIIYLFFVFIS